MASEEYLTTKEVASLLRVSDQTIRSYVKKGMIPAIKFGTSRRSTVRIPKSGLDKFLASMQGSAVEPPEVDPKNRNTPDDFYLEGIPFEEEE